MQIAIGTYQDDPAYKHQVPYQVLFAREARVANLELAHVLVEEVRVEEDAETAVGEEKAADEAPGFREDLEEVVGVEDVVAGMHDAEDGAERRGKRDGSERSCSDCEQEKRLSDQSRMAYREMGGSRQNVSITPSIVPTNFTHSCVPKSLLRMHAPRGFRQNEDDRN